jgi:hypothetical protein
MFHGRELITSHDIIRDAFAYSVREVKFHVSHEQTDVVSLLAFQKICQWVDIMLLVDDICTLINVFITNPT